MVTSKINLVSHYFPLAGVEGFTTQHDHELLFRIEAQLKKRFPVGSQISEHAVVQDFLKQVCAISELE
jgi:hypothetical protein